MARKSVLCDEDRLLIAVIQELRSPVQCVRRHRPVRCTLRIAGVTAEQLRLTVFAHADRIAEINILAIDVDRLTDDLHIIIGNLGQVLLKVNEELFRILSEDDRIRPPCRIPCPCAFLRYSEVGLSCSLNIFRLVRCGKCDTRCRSIADVQRLSRVCSQLLDSTSVCLQSIVGHEKRLAVGKLQPRSVDAFRETQADEALRLIDGEEILDTVGEAFRYDPRIICEPLRHIRVHPAASLVEFHRQFPVEEGEIRFDVICDQLINERVVERNAFLVDRADAFRDNTGPVN